MVNGRETRRADIKDTVIPGRSFWSGQRAGAVLVLISGAVATVMLGVSPMAVAAGLGAGIGCSWLWGWSSDENRGQGRSVAVLNKAVFDSVADGIIGTDGDGRITFANPAAEMLTGWREDQVIGRSFTEIFGLTLSGDNDIFCRETHLPRRQGEALPVEIHVSAILERRRATGRVAVIHDISERLTAEENRRLASAVLESSSQPIMVTDLSGTIVTVNPAFCRLSGYDASDLVGQPVGTLRSDRHAPHYHARIRATLEENGEWQGEIWNRRQDGSLYAVWVSITRIAVASGGSGVAVAFYFDITERKRDEARMVDAANHDALTGLPNRRMLEDRLAALSRHTPPSSQSAVLLIDLDGFKVVNDDHGHDAGDAILCAAARRMGRVIRETDMVARLGGDEFVVLLDGADGQAAARVAQDLGAQLCRPVRFLGQDLRVSASIGIALTQPGQSPAETLKAADQAMYAVKRGGKHGFGFHPSGHHGGEYAS